MKQVVSSFLLFVVTMTSGCCLPDGLVGLQPAEREGVKALLTTIGDYAEESGEERVRRIHAELVTCLEDGRLLRGDCEGEFILGRTCDDVVCLDSDVPFDIESLRRSADNCMLALAILYHEGVHLDQSLADFMFSDHEEDAYRMTHAMQRWLAVETAARVAPLPDVTYTPEDVFEAIEMTRLGMGEEYLAAICPGHSRRRQLIGFVRDHPEEALAWIEVPPRKYELRTRSDDDVEFTVALEVALDSDGPGLTTTYFNREEDHVVPTWPSPRAMIESSKSVEFAIGWYDAGSAVGAKFCDSFNASWLGPKSHRFEDDDLVLVVPGLAGADRTNIALSLTILLKPTAPQESEAP